VGEWPGAFGGGWLGLCDLRLVITVYKVGFLVGFDRLDGSARGSSSSAELWHTRGGCRRCLLTCVSR